MKIIPFKGYIPDLSKISFDDAFYQHMREDFNEVWGRSVFKSADESSCYYILEIQEHLQSSTGLIALTSMEEYAQHHILKHEHTIAAKEKIHRNLHASRKAMIKPAALLIKKKASLQKIMQEVKVNNNPILVFKFPVHQTTQRVWKIDSAVLIKKITRLFDLSIQRAIIADGHHRFASLAHVHSHRNPLHILTVYFSPEEVKVSTFYRLIKKLSSESYSSILDKMKRIALDWKETDHIKPIPHVIHLICQGIIYRFKLKSKSKDPIHLQFSNIVLKKVFNIKDESKSKRLKYIEYPENEDDHRLLIDRHKDDFIFIPPSLTPQQILKNKKILPPKSTLFTPRIINGLVVVKEE